VLFSSGFASGSAGLYAFIAIPDHMRYLAELRKALNSALSTLLHADRQVRNVSLPCEICGQT